MVMEVQLSESLRVVSLHIRKDLVPQIYYRCVIVWMYLGFDVDCFLKLGFLKIIYLRISPTVLHHRVCTLAIICFIGDLIRSNSLNIILKFLFIYFYFRYLGQVSFRSLPPTLSQFHSINNLLSVVSVRFSLNFLNDLFVLLHLFQPLFVLRALVVRNA